MVEPLTLPLSVGLASRLPKLVELTNEVDASVHRPVLEIGLVGPLRVHSECPSTPGSP